ncbi:MAG: PKD domain-containing protein [Sphingobacteriales bacterium]|nr:MAG: PKD domain-containing protein [Sphingobacteriales bacterium]
MKFAPRLLLIVTVLLLYCYLPLQAQSKCEITVSTIKGCVPHPVQFDVTVSGNSSPVKSYYWNFGDQTSGNQQSVSHVFTARGNYYPSVTVVFDDGSTCIQSLKLPIRVFGNPKAEMNVKEDQQIILCNRGETFCFKDLSQRSLDGAPPVSYIWSFGDGSISTEKNPCYAFSDSGTYVMALEVLDTNGCKNLMQRRVKVRFASQVGLAPKPQFKTTVQYNCKGGNITAKVIYTNLTDTAGKGITKFTWDFGDGNIVSCDLRDTACIKKWQKQEITYSQSGTFFPSLYVENIYGCKAKFTSDTSVDIINYKFAVSVYPNEESCFMENPLVNFTASYHPKASYYLWDFGDPEDPGVGQLSSTSHIYSKPGTYTVRLRVKILNCLFDTTLCRKVQLLGPIAKIMPKNAIYRPWDSIPKGGSFLIQKSDYPKYFDTACYADKSVDYYTYNYTKVPNGDTTFTECNATITGYKTDTTLDCNQKPVVNKTPIYKPKIVSVKDKIITDAQLNTWQKGDPLPTGDIYYEPPMINNPLQMDDTSLFACNAPHRVSYTNFSIKYRGYDAVDDYPDKYKEKCFNPSAPFASDSLKYDWDFREGTAGISTTQNPDERSRNSTEKLPTHLFKNEGCYWTKLTVTDPVTGCYAIDSIPVVLQKPDAGWDEKKFGNKMTWLKQNEIGENKGRRGMILFGPPCVNELQGISIEETLPSCYKREFALILDSAAFSYRESCDTNKVNHDFYTRDEVERKKQYRHAYPDTGWKTLGLVIANNADCIDTAWYHNYKYIHMLFPQLDVSSRNICVGDEIKLALKVPEQPGAKLFNVKIVIEADKYDTLAVIRDTIPYIVKSKNGSKEIITSSAHNAEWGINDDKYINNLYDTLKQKINFPGHVTVISYFHSRFGCIDSAISEFTSGYGSDFYVQRNTACTTDTIEFNDVVSYFLPFSQDAIGYDPVRYWKDPLDARGGRKPAKQETISWDFDADGIIDATGPSPKFRYPKAGNYTVRMITTDSLGCEKIVEKKDFMKIIGLQAQFTIAPPIVRYCAPHFYKFVDSSFIIQPAGGTVNVVSWTWDFGDGTPAITITDPKKKDAAHLYLDNGKYTVTLTARTSAGIGTSGGCYDIVSQEINMIGPNANFEPVGPLAGCVPFTLTVKDNSITNSKARVWKLGDGTEKSTSNEDTVKLRYNKPGVYCPQMILTEEIRDLKDSLLYCTDSFPVPKCKYKVIVYAINRLNITSADTVLCAIDDQGTFYGFPDTGYTSFTLDYGNGESETQTKPVFNYSYPDTGHFTLRLTGTNGRCPDTAYMNVRVIDVESNFYRDTLRNDTPTFSFVNISRNGVKFKWEFDDGTPPVWVNNANSITHEFKRSGIVNVCLTAYNEKGCFRKICKPLEIITDVWIPNVFTPNQLDLDNEYFKIRIKGDQNYDLAIYNRWGEIVFTSKDKHRKWNGNLQNDGSPCPEGTYFYVFNYRLIGGKDKVATGTVTLLR